jgi:hypothetical protein
VARQALAVHGCRSALASCVEASETSMQPNCDSGMISFGIAAAPVRLPFSVTLSRASGTPRVWRESQTMQMLSWLVAAVS